jgi:hypothetical protein
MSEPEMVIFSKTFDLLTWLLRGFTTRPLPPYSAASGPY